MSTAERSRRSDLFQWSGRGGSRVLIPELAESQVVVGSTAVGRALESQASGRPPERG